MIKVIDLSKLQADPIVSAIAESEEGLIIISGYVVAVDKNTISISQKRDGLCFVEYPKETIVKAFEDDKDANKTAFLIKGNAKVKHIKKTSAYEAHLLYEPELKSVDIQEDMISSCSCTKDTINETIAKSSIGLQPDGSTIYRKKCRTLYDVWVCDMNGCRRVPYTQCIYYPELGMF